MAADLTATPAQLEAAVASLRAGELVAFPTETVYGLGADARNPAAVRRIFEVKGRPAHHPVIVHLARLGQVPDWARDVPPAAVTLAKRFWPGPLTLVLPRAPGVSDAVTGGQDTVALRVPSHPMAQQLLAAFQSGIAAPSANRYGRVSPTRAEHVREELGSAVKVILDGGDCQIGLESTIVSFQGARVRLLRPGAVTAEQIRAVVGDELGLGADEASPRVPGSTAAHYAPVTPLTIVPAAQIEAQAAVFAGSAPVAVLAWRAPLEALPAVTWINAGKLAPRYGHDLYDHLRTLDKSGCRRILVQEVPEGEEWVAIRDRLRRAAAGAGPDDADAEVEAT